jgi:hypothetical protein
MNLRIDPAKDEFPRYMLVISVLVHLIVFAVCVVLMNISFGTSSSASGYIQVATGRGEGSAVQTAPQPLKEEKTDEPKPDEGEKLPEDAVKSMDKAAAVSEPAGIAEDTSLGGNANMSFNGTNTDTSSLNNVYAEKTLNVTIKYPQGWAYMDQNRKNKLDGVTFMAVESAVKPPPYVHLAVQSKDMFIESRYKYNIKTWNYTAYYNDPEELAGQVSQIFYIRTETNEDYSIKFIMQGMGNFKAFQPVFFGMVKTFKFGGGWF